MRLLYENYFLRFGGGCGYRMYAETGEMLNLPPTSSQNKGLILKSRSCIIPRVIHVSVDTRYITGGLSALFACTSTHYLWVTGIYISSTFACRIFGYLRNVFPTGFQASGLWNRIYIGMRPYPKMNRTLC